MNISQKYLQNNGISEEKKAFYENLPDRYSKFSLEFMKKNYHEHSNFSKKVINWLFNQNEETRMLLCSIENIKYTNTIYDAYTYLKKHQNGAKFCFSEEDNKDEEKFSFDVISSDINKYTRNMNNYFYNNRNYGLNKNPYGYIIDMKEKENDFLNNIVFYQSESPVEDIDNYSSYFTLKKDFLKNEEMFRYCCNILSYDNFLSAPIMIKKEMQNKNNVVSFELPIWITNEIKIKKKQNLNYEDDDEELSYYFNQANKKAYISLSQYCLALIEQALCVRYVLYNHNKNMDEIISSIYLKDLLEKKKKMLSFLDSIDYETNKFYEKFDIVGINTRLFYQPEIENFIKEKNIINEIVNENENNYLKAYNEAKINLKIFENEDLFEGLSNLFEKNKEKFNKDILNRFTFINIDKLYTYEDFSNRLIFEKIFDEYSKKICDDLILDDEKKAKKKRKKKKKNNNNNNNNNNENKINNNEIKEKENNANNKEYIYNFIKNLIFDSLNKKLNESNNKNDTKSNKKEKNNKKEKEFFLYQPTNKKNKQKGNNKKNKNNKNNSNQKEKNNIIKNQNTEQKYENKISNKIITTENKKEYKEDIKINEQNEIKINENNIINEKTLKNSNNISINNIEIQSHINSFTLSSSTNSSSDSLNFKLNSKVGINLINNEIYDTNNLFVVHQNPLISYQKFSKLANDIIDFNEDLESLLVILREIKYEIKNHFDNIINKIYKESKLEIYGSSLYKLDIETSDLDLSICTNEDIDLNDLVTYLNKINHDKKYVNINFISTASIPIIKIDVDFLKLNNNKIKEMNDKLINNDYYKLCIKNNFYTDTNIIKVDITLNSINYNQLNFINQGINQFPQIIYLIRILKKLLIYKHMSNSYKGGMSSYCLFLIIYSFLKMYFSFYPNNPIDNNYGSFLIGFLFHYVMCIDFKNTVINPLLNNPFLIYTYPIDKIPTIIEPTTLDNAGKNIYRIFDVVKTLNEIYRDIFIVIKKDYNDENINYMYELFKYYVEVE